MPLPSRLAEHRQTAAQILSDSRIILVVWLIVGLAPSLVQLHKGNNNNYLMFHYSFTHLVHQQNLYAFYPDQYRDNFKYGPLFCLFMAPFTVLPTSLACVLFVLVSACVLYLAIQSLPLEKTTRNIFGLLCLFEFWNNQGHFHSNAIMAGFIILSFTCILRDKTVLAALYVALGTFIKLYGVVGLLFLVFSRRKGKFLIALAGWSVVFYLLPALLSSLPFVNASYADWFAALQEKNRLNATLGIFQDISVMGFVRRLVGNPNISEVPFLITGGVLLLLPYLRTSCYGDRHFRFLALACVLMFAVLFSTSSENPTYIILQCGVAAWFCAGSRLPLRPRVGLLLIVFLFSSITPTDLFPHALGDFYNAHSLRILPCAAVWLVALYEMLVCRITLEERPQVATA